MMKRTTGSKMMVAAMACAMLFTGVAAEAAVTREAAAATGVSPYCMGYADDVYGPEALDWFKAEKTYYNGSSYLSVEKVSDTRFRIVDECGYWVEFSKNDYLRRNSDGSIEYCYGKTLYIYHPAGDYLTYHYRYDTIDYYAW